MRQRPLCIVFVFLVILLILMKASGIPFWGVPDEKLREYAGSLEGKECIISGRIASREEKANSISYFLKDSYLIKNISFKDINPDSIQNADKVPLHNIRLYFPKDDDKLTIGSHAAVFGKPQLYENASNPGGFGAADYYAAEDCCLSMYVTAGKVIDEPFFSIGEAIADLKEKLRQNINKTMNKDSAAALLAMLFGDRSELTDDIKLDYSAAGISHILSISGMHIAVIGSFAHKMLMSLKVKIKAASVMSSAFIVFYCVFTGSSEPTVRAVIMFVIMQGGRCFLRSYDQLSALSLAGVLMLSARPASLFRAGFQLSFAAAAAMTCVLPILKNAAKKYFKNVRSRAGKFIMDSMFTWLSVNIVTFPIVLYHFFEFPVYSLFANIIFVPLTEIVMISGLAGAMLSLFLPELASLILLLPDWILYIQNEAGGFILKLPFSMLILGKPLWWQMLISLFGIILLMRACRKEKNLMAGAALGIMLSCAVRLPEGFSITALDVGQGDCLFIRNGNYVYMTDGGSSSEKNAGKYAILPYIKSQGINTLEGIFLTHDDNDHMNGIIELLAAAAKHETAVRINRFFMPKWLYESETGKEISDLAGRAGAEVYALQTGDVISFENTEIRVLSPDAESVAEGNEGSLVMSVKNGDFSALLTGDIEGKGEDELLDRLGKYDYLKVPHHGSKNSGGEGFYEKTSPVICIISAPENSIYGHPHPETIERIKNSGAEYFQTGISGAIKVSVSAEKMSVETYKQTFA